ncbi:glycosyltransferase [Dechloromonas agitata]|uniref:glycosyltransferase family 2 protein n=1 Tax=Dechloromonas agitata TaxID=73030 RepID=UPI00237E8EB9|nr:glycosyltransferase family 2 protein [Dechloromonas agitata]MDE1547370.1 glycosyltransferase [Dechloromonas agitata]
MNALLDESSGSRRPFGLSLIMATVGRSDDVGHMIGSLIDQTDRRFELIIVDQNPDDRLLPFVDYAIQAGIDLTHIRLATRGLSLARNAGLAVARYSIVGFPDDDCWYEPDTVKCLLSAFTTDIAPDGLIGHWVEQATAGEGPPRENVLSNDDWRRFRGGDASSITLFVKRCLLDQLNGFDKRFGIGSWYGAAEETDFVLRALGMGATLVKTSKVRVHHRYSRETTGPIFETCRNARKRARGTGGLYAKHRLSTWVVTRGLLAPVFVPLSKGHLSNTLRGVYISLGRLEGMATWRLKEHT